MSIDNLYHKYGAKQVVCDNCGDGFEAEDWDDAQKRMRADGWGRKNVDGHFQHFCPDCKEVK